MKPYVIRSIINGMLSALLAIGGLVGLSYFADSQFGKLALLDDYFKFGLLAATLLLIGVLISWWSTHRAVSKYLKMKLDELY